MRGTWSRMSSSFLAYLVIGKVFIFLGGKFAEGNDLKGFIGRLLLCPLCLGFWVYTILSYIFGEYILDILYIQRPIMAIITGAMSTTVVFIFSSGWNSLFSEISIE